MPHVTYRFGPGQAGGCAIKTIFIDKPESVTATLFHASSGNYDNMTDAVINFSIPKSSFSPLSYQVVSNPGNIFKSGTSSPITVTGLSLGTTYTFTVTATNGSYYSQPSLPSNSVTPFTIPGAPTNISASAGIGQATVSFTAPSDNGGDNITAYGVTSNPGNIFKSGTSSPITVTGLTGGTAYTFTVRAHNAAGEGPYSSPSNSVIPTFTTPDSPTYVSATAGNAQAIISFAYPNSNGSPITSFTVTSNPDNKTVTGTSSPITVTGLTGGTAYTFTVKATNAAGDSPNSSPTNTVTPYSIPSAPTNISASAGIGQATVSFTAPSNNGSPITSYTVISNPGNHSTNGTSSPITMTGLTGGTAYTFTVSAHNAAGDGPNSSPSNSIIISATVPSAPAINSVSAGGCSAFISFVPPDNDGASPIISYVVTSNPGNINAYGTKSPIAVTGLLGGTTYNFSMAARNSVGWGPYSPPSNSITTCYAPSAPTNISAYPQNAGAYVFFSAPDNNGGSTITSYTVTSNPGNISASGPTGPIKLNGLSNGTSYNFTVKAYNGAFSPPSNISK